MEKTSFYDLSFKERNNIAKTRMKTSKYIVWDYARDNETNECGTLEELPHYIDKGFIHGFVLDNPKVKTSISWREINAYADGFYLDEEFENRTLYPYHLFTDYNKALEYSEKAKEHAKMCDKPTLKDVLNVVSKYDKSAYITEGKRGYQNVKYKAIKIGYGTTIIRLDDKGNILLDRGQMFTSFLIPHIDLLDNVLEIFYDRDYSSEGRNSRMATWAIPW